MPIKSAARPMKLSTIESALETGLRMNTTISAPVIIKVAKI